MEEKEGEGEVVRRGRWKLQHEEAARSRSLSSSSSCRCARARSPGMPRADTPAATRCKLGERERGCQRECVSASTTGSRSLFVSSVLPRPAHTYVGIYIHVFTHGHAYTRTTKRCVSFALWARPLSLERPRGRPRSRWEPAIVACASRSTHSPGRRRCMFVLSVTCDYRAIFRSVARPTDRTAIFSHVTHDRSGRTPLLLPGHGFRRSVPNVVTTSALPVVSSAPCLFSPPPYSWILLRSFREDPRTDKYAPASVVQTGHIIVRILADDIRKSMAKKILVSHAWKIFLWAYMNN